LDTAGFAKVTINLERGATLWASAHLPQNRDMMMVPAGDGSLTLYKYVSTTIIGFASVKGWPAGGCVALFLFL
jgi:hypothetical protein